MWFGTTITNDNDMQSKGYDLFCSTGCEGKRHAKRFISIEPLLGEISAMALRNIQFLDWVIIGQQTGPGAVPPKAEWVQNIIDQCRAAGVPVFVKHPLYEKFPIQQWPEGLVI
jgi:protein gp37